MFVYFLFFGDTLTLNDIPYGGHVRVHIVNGPISDEWWIKTEYTPTAVDWSVNIYICLAYDLTVRDEWQVTWHDFKQDIVGR